MEIAGEFTYSLELVSQEILNNLGIAQNNIHEHPYVLNHFSRIKNRVMDADVREGPDIQKYVSHILQRSVEISNSEDDNSKICIPYAIAWGVRQNDWVFENLKDTTLRYLLDQALDYPQLVYTQMKMRSERDLGYQIRPIYGLKNQITTLDAAIEKIKNIQNKLRIKNPTLSKKERF